MRRRVALALHLSALLATALPLIARAQVAGTIVDSQGRPIPRVLVELWSPQERLAAQPTTALGRFSFNADVASRATALLARRVSYAALRIPLQPPDSTLRLELLQLPLPLARTAVAATSTMCPAPDSRPARDLWELVRERYDAGAVVGRWADFLVDSRRVRAESLGVIDTMRLGIGQSGVSRRFLDGWSRHIRDSGYARPYGGMVRRFDRWEYPPLWSLLAAHFAAALFGELHTFATDTTLRGEVVLRFCPRQLSRPRIHGALVLGRDTTMVRASWRFSTAEPSEDAGGEVIFAPPDLRRSRYALLPISGFYWRKLVFDFYQEWTEYRAWHTCADEPTNPICRSR